MGTLISAGNEGLQASAGRQTLQPSNRERCRNCVPLSLLIPTSHANTTPHWIFRATERQRGGKRLAWILQCWPVCKSRLEGCCDLFNSDEELICGNAVIVRTRINGNKRGTVTKETGKSQELTFANADLILCCLCIVSIDCLSMVTKCYQNRRTYFEIIGPLYVQISFREGVSNSGNRFLLAWELKYAQVHK